MSRGGHRALPGQHAALQHGLGVTACDSGQRRAPLLCSEASDYGSTLPLEARCRRGHVANPQQHRHVIGTAAFSPNIHLRAVFNKGGHGSTFDIRTEAVSAKSRIFESEPHPHPQNIKISNPHRIRIHEFRNNSIRTASASARMRMRIVHLWSSIYCFS